MESLWKDKTPKERYELRISESKTVAEAFIAWLDALRVLPKSTIGLAANYALSQRGCLMNVYLDGRLELSNNRAENAIRRQEELAVLQLPERREGKLNLCSTAYASASQT